VKKLTRKDKIKIAKELKKKAYSQGKHDVLVGSKVVVTVTIEGKHVFFPSGRKLPVPEECWV